MKRTCRLLVGALLLAAPGLALAQGTSPRWSYVEAGYIDFDPDAGSSENGAFAGASIKLFKMFHALAEYDDVGDLTFWNVGFGWHGLLGEQADLYANAVWNDYDEDDGYAILGGARWKVREWLEVNGQVRWLDLDEGGSETLYRVGALATILNDRLGFGADWEIGDADTLRAYVRFNFGR